MNLKKIGRPMMYEDPFDLDYTEIMKAIKDNTKGFAMFVL